MVDTLKGRRSACVASTTCLPWVRVRVHCVVASFKVVAGKGSMLIGVLSTNASCLTSNSGSPSAAHTKVRQSDSVP
jgi:hypothetical protein